MGLKLTEKREELVAKHKILERAIGEAGVDHDFTKVTAFGEDLDTQGKVDEFRKLNVELDVLTKACQKLEFDEIGANVRAVRERMAAPVETVPHPTGNDGQKSLGQRFVESEQYEEYKGNHDLAISVSFPDIGLKTLFATDAGWAPESLRTGRLVDAVTRPVQVLDLIPQGQTNSASVVYMEESLRTHSAAEKIEGATFAESAFELTERTVQVRKVTDSIPATDEQLEDEAQIRSYLDQRLRFGLRQRLDNQVMNGTGIPPFMEGILNVSGIQTQAKGADPRFDAIHKAMTKIRVTGRAFPNAIVLHPTDWEQIRLTRTADGIYILGNPAIAGPLSLFGVQVVLGDVLSVNTGLVGDFANWCMLFERRGVNVQVGYTGSQFVEGKSTIRADLRAAFVVFRPAAFCTVTGL